MKGYDFQHATKLQRQANGFSITANAGLAENTYELEHLPCEIRYEIKTISERSWLLRYQKKTEDDSLVSKTTGVVCADVKEIQIEIPNEAENNQTKWETIPDEFVIHFVFTDTNRETLSIAFHGQGI